MEGKFHGEGTYKWHDKYCFIGKYKNGMKSGKGRLYYNKNMNFIEGNWVDDKK